MQPQQPQPLPQVRLQRLPLHPRQQHQPLVPALPLRHPSQPLPLLPPLLPRQHAHSGTSSKAPAAHQPPWPVVVGAAQLSPADTIAAAGGAPATLAGVSLLLVGVVAAVAVAAVMAVAGAAAVRVRVGVLVAAPHRLTEPPPRAARTRGSATVRDSASLPLMPTLVGPDCVC
jgi:hypothetical protein